MKIFVFAYDRYATMTTSLWLDTVPHTVLVHTQEAADRFIKFNTIGAGGDILITNQPRGLAYQRQYAMDLLKPDEWAVFFVDDLISCTYLPHPEQFGSKLPEIDKDNAKNRHMKELLMTPCPPDKFIQVSKELILEAEARKLALVGFSLTDSLMFRGNKYSTWSLADGRCWLIKKTHLKFDMGAQLIDDTCFTALNLKTFGGVLVYNWLLPLCKRYTEGAFGTKEQRMEQKLRECKYLVDTYPEYIAYADKEGWPPLSHVKIRQRKTVKEQTSLF